MFARLFAERGISLDRLRALVEVGAAGGIARAAGEDLARQSLYSRQLKELEDFFQTGLTERHGKGIRLTSRGKELARISRFFLMGLSNFQSGCRAEAQSYRIGAGATFLEIFLIPGLAPLKGSARYEIESVSDDDIERRLHDLTLDFGIVQRVALSRPLQLKKLSIHKLVLWTRRSSCRTPAEARQRLRERRLPLVWPKAELSLKTREQLWNYEPSFVCGTFSDAMRLVEVTGVAAFLPDFLCPASGGPGGELLVLEVASQRTVRVEYSLAWNPRLLRLNPHASRQRDALIKVLSRSPSPPQPQA